MGEHTYCSLSAGGENTACHRACGCGLSSNKFEKSEEKLENKDELSGPGAKRLLYPKIIRSRKF